MSLSVREQRLILSKYPFDEENLRMLEDQLGQKRPRLYRKISMALCLHLGFYIRESILLSQELRQACDDRLKLWKEIRKAYKQGKDLEDIKRLPGAQERLEQMRRVSFGPTAEEYIAYQALLSVRSSPMPVHEAVFFKRSCLSSKQLILLEQEITARVALLYQLLSPRGKEITDEEYQQLESFYYSKTWGIIRHQSVRWVHIVHLWASKRAENKDRVDPLNRRFLIPQCRIEYPVPARLEELDSDARQLPAPALYLHDNSIKVDSVRWTLQAFLDRLEAETPSHLKIELGPTATAILFQELYTDELLRGELFMCLEYTSETGIQTTKYGSPFFKEVFGMIKLAIALKQKARVSYPWFIESLLHSTPHLRQEITKRIQQNDHLIFVGLRRVHILYEKMKGQLSSSCLMQFAILLANPDQLETPRIMGLIYEKGLVKDPESFLLSVLMNPVSIFHILHDHLEQIQSKLSSSFKVGSPPCSTIALKLASLLMRYRDRFEKLEEFNTLFVKMLPFNIEGTILYTAVLRFCEGKFSKEDVQAISLPLAGADMVELLTYPIPRHKKSCRPEERRLTSLSEKYALTRLQSARLFLQFHSPELMEASKDYEIILDFCKKAFNSPFSPELCFNLLFYQPFKKTPEAYAHLESYLNSLQRLDERVSPLPLAEFERVIRQRLTSLENASQQIPSSPSKSPQKNSPSPDPHYPQARATVQRLINVLYEQFVPNMQNVMRFLQIEWVSHAHSSVSLATPHAHTLFLTDPDLPQGPALVGEWHTPQDLTSFPTLEVRLMDPRSSSLRCFRWFWQISVENLKNHPYLLLILPRLAQHIFKKTSLFLKPFLEDNFLIPAGSGLDLENESPHQTFSEDPEILQLWNHYLPEGPQKEDFKVKTMSFLQQLFRWYYLTQRDLINRRTPAIPGSPLNSTTSLRSNICVYKNTQGQDIPQPRFSHHAETTAPLPPEFQLPLSRIATALRENYNHELRPLGHPTSEETILWKFLAQERKLTFKLRDMETTWSYASVISHPDLEKLIHLQISTLMTRVR